MCLLDLPPELLSGIIDLTFSYDLESFALTCRTVYRCAKSQIARHNSLKRQWKHTSNAYTGRRNSTLSILYAISQEPIVAEYIESLSLWDRRSAQEISSDTNSPYNFHEGEALQKIRDMLLHTEYFADSAGPRVAGWWEEILEEPASDTHEYPEEPAVTVALLTLLPRLKTLQLPERWDLVRVGEGLELWIHLIEALVSQPNGNESSSRPLQLLQTLLPFAEVGFYTRVNLQSIHPFMALKSLQNLYAVSCVAVEDEWDDSPPLAGPYPTLRSFLTRVEFASGCIDTYGLEAFLQMTPALTVFKYSHQSKQGGLQHDWNPGGFAQVLSRYCGTRLIELALTVDEIDGDIVNGLSSFHGFPALKELEVDLGVFFGPPLESGQSLGLNAKIPTDDKPWTHKDIPCLGDMLAPNIEKVQLNTDYLEHSKRGLKALVKNIKDKRRDKLTKLKSVIIRQYTTGTAKAIAQAHDCTLEVFDDPRPKNMMPSWKRQFDYVVGGVEVEGHQD
ncbi:hypothetical protein K505DRAFT_324675 [Melanomma pulvis-pyrius CBS 109.77]|uniref:F-box domain-containing protein n=1 Tax=Melanomma pulvis-pyrius CBS 109.77 TaxID=1314802 RepID=A0A6A6XE92_9PLEO|nr:hypothetical protein K505DRAFT_324675 [Melanomma pulvis-pyrius CBS 109.77]